MADETVQQDIDQNTNQGDDPTMEQWWEDAKAKAQTLMDSSNPKRNILPFSMVGDSADEHVVGFIYEPDGLTDVKLAAAKLQGFDSSLPKAVQALESLMLFDQSDPRMRQKKYMNGAALYLLSLVEIALPEIKKK